MNLERSGVVDLGRAGGDDGPGGGYVRWGEDFDAVFGWVG